MKRKLIPLVFAVLVFAGCEKQVTVNPASSPQQPDKVIEKNTTIVNPPEKPAVEEKKTTTTTTSQ